MIAAAGLSVWFAVDQYGNHTGRAIVQAVNGTLYEILPTGIQVLAAGQDLPDGVEIRTAKDSDAMLQLKDGSVVELRERSGFSTTQAANDLTIRLGRGSVIVQAAKRSSGHLYVATADCRVAVTGTVFSVSSGVKGSRVSVIQGEVHVSQDNKEKVLHPGDQTVTSPNLEPVSVKDDIAWSRNREKLTQQLESLRSGLHADPDARAALLQQAAGTPARVHGLLRQHSESGRLPGPDAERVQPEDGGESRTARLVGQRTPPTSDRSWKNCAPPASTWATRSSSPASPAPMAKFSCRSSSPR